MPGPKTFVSYSWSSPEHQQWVIDLATQLRENGVDAILDKWDLKEGHDSIAFMERMVTDPTVEKVIMVSDRVYAEKADGRRGGVGAEAQIVSPQIYAKADQNKFVAVVSELDAEGKPFLPTYYGARIFLDLSKQEIYPENFEQLVRWIFGKPAFPKPQLGQPPTYLEEQTVLLPTKSRAWRAVDLLQKGSNLSESALREYFDTLAESLESLRLDGKADPFDQAVVDSIDAFLPYRDEFVRVITTLARNDPAESAVMTVKRFFEAVVHYRHPLATMTSWTPNWFDNFKFIIHELFLYTTAVFLKQERFSAVDHFLSGGFYVGGIQNFSHQPIQGVGVFLAHVDSFETRKKRLSLNRFSLHADIIKERSKIAGIGFEELMQADLVIFMRDAVDAFKSNQRNVWYPETLVFAERRREQPFEIFARARSKRYFEKIKESLGVHDKAELEAIVQALGTSLYRPQWHYFALNPAELMDIGQIATVA